jgi:hypothetical protein
MKQLELKILWLPETLGIALNYRTTKGLLPITPYYFWPIGEAWTQIRMEIESKAWFSNQERVKTLNTIVDIMQCWQDSPQIEKKDY